VKYVELYKYTMRKDRNRLLLRQAEVSSRSRKNERVLSPFSDVH